jgi:hypothetical protein
MKTLPPPPPICADVYIDHVSPKIMLMHRTKKKLKNYAVVWLLTTANQTMTRSTKLELCFIVFNIYIYKGCAWFVVDAKTILLRHRRWHSSHV